LEALRELHDKYPEDAEVGESLARELGKQPLSKEEMDQLRLLVDNYNLSEEEITNQFVGQSRFKDKYKVAVCFPFMVEEVNQDRRLNSNQWVLDLFQGIQLAHGDLTSDNVDIELYAYDTKRDSLKMAEKLLSDELQGMDLIIGPLYPGPSKIASDFAFEQKINILNPLSSNGEIIFNNPYSFLFHPSDQTQAKVAGNFMAERLDTEKKALIIYSSRSGDSIAANQYRSVLVEKGIEVIMMEPIPTVDSEQVAKFVSDNLYQIFTPEPDDPVLLVVEKDDEEEDNRKEVFIPRSDLGHVFVASTNELVVANVIGTLDNIGAQISIMGSGRWLQSRYIEFQQLERLQVYMAAPDYIDYSSDKYKNFQKRYRREFAMVPDNYSFIGYDLMMFFGKMLNQAGTYFQNELRQNTFYPGYIFQGFNYQTGNDNAHIPIVHFENGVLVQANRIN
jgi:ABC-type branched-subunit amino acid transport system substrate-binding protein